MGRVLDVTMTEPQSRFFQLEAKYPLFCGGFGTGKTEAMTLCATRDALLAPNGLIALYEPTYDLVRLILAPRMEQRLQDLGVRYRYNKTENIIYTSSGGCGDFVLRTLDNPERIIGYESYRAHVDEIDTLKQEQATLAWRKIIARNRQRPRGLDNPFNRVSAYTTPEGFRFAYETWVKNPKPGYVLVQAPTRTNPFLPPDYISSLRDSYPPQLIEAYLEGKFVNLNSGAVYPDFCRKRNHVEASVEPGEPVHVGVDFNVYNCTAIVFVIRNDKPIAVREFTGMRDTPAMAAKLRDEFKAKGHHVSVYPDASGRASKTINASQSDIQILKDHGLQVFARDANPAVRDRVNAVNALICDGNGTRTLMVNTNRCPVLTEALEQQVYDKHGDPDKEAGKDHPPDAAGYFLHYRWPVVKPVHSRSVPLTHMAR